MEIESQLESLATITATTSTFQEPAEIEESTTDSTNQETIVSATEVELSNASVALSALSETDESTIIEDSEEAEQVVTEIEEASSSDPSAALQAQSGEVDSDLVTGLLV